MNWFLVFTSCALCLLIIGIRVLIANHRTSNHRTYRKRYQLINRWKNTDHLLAMNEFDEVEYNQHAKALLLFRNPKKLYGPLTQGIWDNDDPQLYSPYWWRCYNEIYLNLPNAGCYKKEIKELLAKETNPISLPRILIEVTGRVIVGLPDDEPSKFTMIDGAEEYDQIIAAQEMMDV